MHRVPQYTALVRPHPTRHDVVILGFPLLTYWRNVPPAANDP